MTTHDTGKSGGTVPQSTGKRNPRIRMFTGVLAVCLVATLVAGYGDDKSERSARRQESMLRIAAHEKEKKAPGYQEYKQGVAAFEKEEFEEAAKLFRTGAEKGNSNAMVMLSYVLEEGKGTEKDDSASKLWMLKAADKGNAIAQAICGVELVEVSEKNGLRYLRQSANQGCVFGQYFLGTLYLNDKDKAEEAVMYLRRAAVQPLTSEKNVLDYVMENDPDDLAGMFGLDTGATNTFVIISQYLLGSTYMDGEAVGQDLDEAKKWLEMVKGNGMQIAEEMLDRIEALQAAKKFADAAEGMEKYEDGIAAFKDGEFEEAVKLFRAGAEKGSEEAMMMLSKCLDEGIGTEEDVEETVEWMKKAADKGNAIAQALYGMHLSDLGETEESLVYLQKSADQDCVLGNLLLGGTLLKNKDEAEKGFEILLKVAKLPPSDETSVLDYMKDEEDLALLGEDVSAANSIIAMAQCLVGSAYIRGEGVKRDFSEGEKWIRQAAAGGFVTAKELLEMIEDAKNVDEDDEDDADGDDAEEIADSGEGVEEFKQGLAAFEGEEFGKAANLFRSAAEKGSADAMMMYAVCLGEGKGVEKDDREAYDWLRKAARAGNAIAQALYGCNLLDKDNRKDGFRYLQKSADQGLVFGLFSLGIAFKSAGDEKKALEYLLKTALQIPTEEPSYINHILSGAAESFEFDSENAERISATDKFIAVAQFLVGGNYLMGVVVERNLGEALKWFRMSAESGFIPAVDAMERLDTTGKDEDDDEDDD